MTTPTTSPDRFHDSETLRAALIRICNTPDGWRTDPEADELICYAAERFTQMAIKHGLAPEDAMSAVFEALRSPAVRFGMDPWGVVVTAVATTFRAWQFADEALTSIDTARRGGLSGCRADRFGEREQHSWQDDLAMSVDFIDDLMERLDGFDEADECADSEEPDPTPIWEQALDLADWLARLGWPRVNTLIAVEIVLRKLADAGSRPTCYEALRRERRWRAISGLPATSWTALLRLLLGTPGDDVTPLGKGILLRQALGESLEHLAGDKDLIKTASQAAPLRKAA